jgi:allantoin racemase
MYMIEDILKAERQGYGAAMVGPHWDPGLLAAREAASIPVTGPGESAMLVAQTLGAHFAILTVREGYVPMIERNLRVYGFESRAIARKPVRRFGMTFDNLVSCLKGSSDEFLVEFEKTARDCISDGADVIIAGGQFFGPVFLRHQFFAIPNTGVPVVDCAACGLKLAEMLASLRSSIRLTKSEHVNAPFTTPPRELLDRVRSEFGLSK